MKTTRTICLVLAALAAAGGPALLRAQDTNPPPGQVNLEPGSESLTNLSPAELRARIREVRARHALQAASKKGQRQLPAERLAQLKARRDHLRLKKANGGLTPAEQKLLDHLEAALGGTDQSPTNHVPRKAPRKSKAPKTK